MMRWTLESNNRNSRSSYIVFQYWDLQKASNHKPLHKEWCLNSIYRLEDRYIVSQQSFQVLHSKDCHMQFLIALQVYMCYSNRNLLFLCYYFRLTVSFQASNPCDIFYSCASTLSLKVFTERTCKHPFLQVAFFWQCDQIVHPRLHTPWLKIVVC